MLYWNIYDNRNINKNEEDLQEKFFGLRGINMKKV